MKTRNEIEGAQAWRVYTDRERNRAGRMPATLGNGNGVIQVSTRPGWVYVRLHGDSRRLVRALNKSSVPLVENFPVDVERIVEPNGGYYKVIGASTALIFRSDPAVNNPDPWNGFIRAHGTQHMLGDRGTGGFDPVYTDTRMLLPLRARQQETADLTLHVEGGRYYLGGWHTFAGGDTAALTLPGAGSIWDVVCIDASGNLSQVAGVTTTYNATPQYPASGLTDLYPLAFVYLTDSTTAIEEAEICDARTPLTLGGGGGGSGTPSDTVADETTFGITPDAGAATAYARGDHTHGSPSAPSVPSAASSVTTETGFGQASSAGAASTYSRGDHTHGTPGHDDHGALSGLGDDDHSIYIKADGTRAFSGDQSFGTHEATNAKDPTAAQSLVTRNYLEAQLAGIGGGVAQDSFVVSGGGVDWVGTNFDYIIAAAIYYINGVRYTSPQTSLTLDAADADDRIDVIALTTSGTAVIVKGQAATNPSEPDIDPATQVLDSFIYVAGGSSTPTTTGELLYKDDGGSSGTPVEWNWTTSGTGFNVNSSTNPRGGSGKDIEGTAVANNAYAQGQRGSGTIDPNAFDNLVIYIRSKASWNTSRYLLVSLLSTNTRRGNALRISSSGTWGFDSANTTDYQAIVIPTLQFAIPAGTTINQIRIADSGGSIGFYIDDIAFLSGASGGGTGGITQEQADARYAQRAQNLADLNSAATARTNLGLGTAALLASTTSVGSPGSDTNLPTEKAVRTAIAGLSSGLADPGSNGIVKRTALNTTGVAAASDVTGLFSGAGDYLKSDGTKGTPAGGSVTVKEQDGAPSVSGVTEIRVPNGTLTDNSGGAVSIAPTHAALGDVSADQHHNYDHSHAGSAGNAQKLLQANTHETPDTDAATSSLHHTIGASGTQAAAGNHTHSYGTGDVVGPGSATDNAIARYDSTTGKLLQNSLATVDDSGGVNIPPGQTYNINGSPHAHSYAGLDAGMSLVVNDGGIVITAGDKFDFAWPWSGTLTGWDLVGYQSGSLTVDILEATYASFPGSAASIFSTKPALSTAQKNQAGGLSIAITKGNWARLNVPSGATTITLATLALYITRS
jgi:hypothetical protein